MSVRGSGPRIVALGGGGFGEGVRDQALDQYLVSLSGCAQPRICLLPTASGDPLEQISRFEATFRWLGATTSHVSLFRLGDQPLALRHHLLAQDIIYVGGGSLLNLMTLWRAHGIDRILQEAWRAGVLLCGVSAGSMCWFASGITKSHGAPAMVGGLGLIPASNSVHYDTQLERRSSYLEHLRLGLMPGGWGVDDGAALVFEGSQLVEVVTARAGSAATRVDLVGAEVVEVRLGARVLQTAARTDRDADPSLSEYRRMRSAGRTPVTARRV